MTVQMTIMTGWFGDASGQPYIGRVFFTQSADRVLATDGTRLKSAVVATLVNGTLHAELVSTGTDGTNPNDFTYQVTFDLRTGTGERVDVESFDVDVPAGGPLDLRTVTPVTPSNGVPTIVGPSAYAEWLAAGHIGTLDDFYAYIASFVPSGGEGGASARPYQFTTPLAQWSIAHNLGRLPVVQTWVDGALVDTSVSSTTTTTLVTWPEPTVGTAVLS